MAKLDAYKLYKAQIHVRRAMEALEDMEVDNAKVQGDFRGILEYVKQLIDKAKRYENTTQNHNQKRGAKAA